MGSSPRPRCIVETTDPESKGYDEVDRLSKLLTNAEKLDKKLQSELFEVEFAEVLSSFTAGFEDLPARLIELSERLGRVLDSIGKRGHKNKTLASQWLVEVSEFVRMSTGQHYDEHLAELFQAVTSGRRPLSDDISGDAIRKTREDMAKT